MDGCLTVKEETKLVSVRYLSLPPFTHKDVRQADEEALSHDTLDSQSSTYALPLTLQINL